MGAAIIADVDAAPVLESAEHVLDLVPAAVERGVVRGGRGAPTSADRLAAQGEGPNPACHCKGRAQ